MQYMVRLECSPATVSLFRDKIIDYLVSLRRISYTVTAEFNFPVLSSNENIIF